MANVSVNVGFVPRAGKTPGVAGTPTDVDEAIVNQVKADVLRLKRGDYFDAQQKQIDKDRKARPQTPVS